MRLVGTEQMSIGEGVPESGASLIRALGELHGIFGELLEIAGRKLDGIRRADAADLMQIATQETRTLQRLFDVEQARSAATASLARELQQPVLVRARLSELANRLPQPLASQISAYSLRLRAVSEKLKRKNAIVADVAKNLQCHIRGIFESVARGQQESFAYGPDGRPAVSETRPWMDAVG